MALYHREGSKVFWFRFKFRRQRIQKSSGTKNRRAAGNIESAYRVQLAQGLVGIKAKKKPGTLEDFGDIFLAEMKSYCQNKPRTYEFWSGTMKKILAYRPIAKAKLDELDEELIAKFVSHSLTKVKAPTVNRRLATLRRALRLALDWKLIDRDNRNARDHERLTTSRSYHRNFRLFCT